jgi:predicted 2-oxoglutarate/Fe(II)-dependent dioxygenase YbiX
MENKDINGLKISILKNFITQEDADIIINYIDNNYLNSEKFYTTERAKKNNRFKYEAHIQEVHKFSDHEEILPLLNKYSDKFLLECNSFFKDEEEIYLAAHWLTMFGEGTKLPRHVDNHVEAEHLFRSGVVYLNDDYEGGFLRFTDEDITIDPEKLSLVIFESTRFHEITEVLSGKRIAMPMWATNIKEKAIR